MANVTVNIPSPVLQGSEKFKVRYRELPNGAYTAYQDETSNTFVLSGLNVGNYEIEIIFVTEDGAECDPAYYYKTILPEFACWDFVATQIESPANSGLYYIQINFASGTQPPCGWKITVTPIGGSARLLTYPTLPASNTINIPVQNVINTLTVTANLCGGNEKDCYTVNTTPVPTPPSCTGATILDAALIPPIIFGQPWTLFIQFSQSNPPTVNAHITWQQIGTPRVLGQPLDSGSFIQAGYIFGGTPTAATIYIATLSPTNVFTGQFTYNVRFLDKCGNWLTTQVIAG